MHTLQLTDAQFLALRYVLGEWVLTSSAKANAPFCYHNCEEILDSQMGGYYEDELWENPVCMEWYENRDEHYRDCDCCGNSVLKTAMFLVEDEEWYCPECFKDKN
jgi:hypothetical protein